MLVRLPFCVVSLVEEERRSVQRTCLVPFFLFFSPEGAFGGGGLLLPSACLLPRGKLESACIQGGSFALSALAGVFSRLLVAVLVCNRSFVSLFPYFVPFFPPSRPQIDPGGGWTIFFFFCVHPRWVALGTRTLLAFLVPPPSRKKEA